jgi:iron complex outermembrane recepter protein
MRYVNISGYATIRCMRRFRSILGLTAVALTGLAGMPVLAQRADDNAIADAEDAFGSADGGETLGIYVPVAVRGFSPVDAGNVRLDGLYVDRQGDFSPRLVEGNRIRVGPAAANYALPAPSGVVDYRLRTPGDEAMLSIVGQVNSWSGGLLEVDAVHPIRRGELSIGAGMSVSRSEYASGNNADIGNLACITDWRPFARSSLKLFWSRTRIADEDIYPIILGDGRATPARLERRRFLGQHWADVETERSIYGFVGKTSFAGLAIRGGLFRSVNEVTEGHNVFLNAAEPGEPAERTVNAYPGRRGASTSGEIGVARGFATGELDHGVQLVLRGRDQDRRYGGGHHVSLRPARFGEPDHVEAPDFFFTEQTIDGVRQWSVGVDYRVRREGIGQLSAGVQKVDYRKRVTPPSGPAPESHDSPWLLNASASIDLAPSLMFYGSYTRGLEESDVAPEIAINRDEAPPAIRTRQLDVGARVRFNDMTVIAGAFDIARPYYGVDDGNVFRELGAVRHRGIELSLSGSPATGLTLVGGGTLLRARLYGDEVASGSVGRRPIDVPAHKLIASLDWRPPSSPTSIDLAVEHTGPNTGDTLNRVRVPSYTTVNIGLRHRFAAGNAPAMLRLQATNLFNAYGWEVAGNNAFIYIQPRQYLMRLAMDF